MGDDFSEQVKRALASRVGHLCSNPDCRALTTGPQNDPAKALNVGVAAHITAASPGGPRYDADLLPEERSAASNGVWLCQTCAKLVDNDSGRFTVDVLNEWKEVSEADARKRVGKTAAFGSAPSDKSSGTLRLGHLSPQNISVSLEPELQHAGKITRYRLGITSSRLIENLKVSIAGISPWATEGTYAAYNVHFPFRVWRGFGVETEGCRVNPNEIEWFDLLRWWIGGSSEQVMVELGGQIIEGPSSQWQIDVDVTWAEGGSKVKALASSTDNKLRVVLADP